MLIWFELHQMDYGIEIKKSEFRQKHKCVSNFSETFLETDSDLKLWYNFP